MTSQREPKRHLRALADAPETERASATTDVLAGLAAAVQGGDGQAWSTLYRRTFDGLYRHVGYLVQDPVVAEDLTQEAFAIALRRIGSFDGQSKFETWLHGIGVNVVRTHWRSDQRRARAHDRLARHMAAVTRSDRGGDPELSHARRQRAAALLEVVQGLPTKLREAYVLVDLRELPRQEAAAQLGITPANLSVRASRARVRVREELAQLGWIEDGGEA